MWKVRLSSGETLTFYEKFLNQSSFCSIFSTNLFLDVSTFIVFPSATVVFVTHQKRPCAFEGLSDLVCEASAWPLSLSRTTVHEISVRSVYICPIFALCQYSGLVWPSTGQVTSARAGRGFFVCGTSGWRRRCRRPQRMTQLGRCCHIFLAEKVQIRAGCFTLFFNF